MTICRLMIEDFKTGTGRWGNPDKNGFTKNSLLYSDYNLREGIDYAQWLISMQFDTEPFLEYNLRDFIAWAARKLKRKTNERRMSWARKI